MSQPYSSSGFYKAPVSKGLIILSSILSTSFILLGPRFQSFFVYSNDFLLAGKEIWRLLTCKLAFHEVHSLLLGASLIYHFRLLERRYGSRKFTSFLLGNLILCIGVEAAGLCILHHLEYNLLPLTLCGPQSLVLSLFVPFILDVPNVGMQNNLVAELLAGKWMSYVLGIYLTTLTHTTSLAIVYGILAGVLYRCNVFLIKSWTKIPNALAQLCERTFGWVLASRLPNEGPLPMGATLEIQRQQRMEYLEQRMFLSQAQRFRTIQRQNAIRRPLTQTFPVRRPFLRESIPEQHGGSLPTEADSPSTPSPQSHPPTAQSLPQEYVDEPSTSHGIGAAGLASITEDRIQQLVDMGFNRGAVMQALRMSNNDVTMATTVLVQE